MGPVHHLRGLPVDPPGQDPEFFPEIEALLRGPADQGDLVFLHPVVFHHGLGQVQGDGRGFPIVRRDAVLQGQTLHFFRVLDFVARGPALADLMQNLHQVAAVVGMGGRPGGDHPGQVAGHDDIGIGAANALLGAFPEGVDPAGPHDAVAAGEPQFAIAAGRLLFQVAVPDRLDVVLGRLLQHKLGIFTDGKILNVAHGLSPP